MKIITVGAGFIASHLPYDNTKYRLAPSKDNILQFIEDYKPDVIINGIGFCGSPNIDQCEELKSRTYMTNVIIPAMLAEECEKHNIRMIQIGSGCIYFGESPNKYYSILEGKNIDSGWKEEDFANPKSFYSKTKYACDLLLSQMSNNLTLRIRMPISNKDNPRNLINKLRNYKQVIDIPNSVTFVDDLVRCVDWAIKENKTGIFHVTNTEPLTAAKVMKEYQYYNSFHSFEIITEAELDLLTVAKRSNCIIDNSKLEKAGFKMSNSEEALQKCMQEYWENI